MPTSHKQFWIGSLGFTLIGLAITSGQEWRLTPWSAVFFGLAAAAFSWGLFGERLLAMSRSAPSRHDWIEQENRFNVIEDEMEAIRSSYNTGLVQWSVYPMSQQRAARNGFAYQPRHPERSRQRFEQEAEHAGQILKRAGYVVPGYPSAAETDGFDYWMSAIASNVAKESDMTGSGIDSIGKSTSEHIGRVVDASKLLCALMASRSRP